MQHGTFLCTPYLPTPLSFPSPLIIPLLPSSQPNYVAMIANGTFGVTGDGNYVVDAVTVIDRLESKGISWGVSYLPLMKLRTL